MLPIPKALNVFLYNRLSGRILRNHNRLSFVYDKKYIESDGMPISLSLPLREEPYDDFAVQTIFGGFLPEGGLLRAISKAVHIDKHNTFGLLCAYGKECAGAISITEDEFLPELDTEYMDITEKLKEYFAQPEQRQRLFTFVKARLSLAGGQDKLPVKFDAGRFLIPCRYAPTTHILKPDSFEFPGTARNEALCMDLAAQTDLPVCEHELITISGKNVYSAKRFDRQGLRRLHQEDFCQAMEIGNSGKYQTDGYYDGIRDVVTFCREHGIRQPENFFGKAIILNLILGNMDGHLKNFSILYDEGMSVAPLYDIVCTSIYPGLSETFGIAIGQAFHMEEVNCETIRAFAEDLNLDCREVCSDAVKLSETVLENLTETVCRHRDMYGDDGIYDVLSSEISSRAETVARMFGAAMRNSPVF